MDFEGGFGKNTREIVGHAEEIINIGISGINIEDSLKTGTGLMDAEEFCERISAIRSLSESLGFHLVINARTDVFLSSWGSPDARLGETIRRGNKYIDAGADCIFAPDVFEKETIGKLVKEIKGPLNILANSTNGKGLPPSLPELKKLGVARLSLGSSLQKSTLALVRKIADEISREGTYGILSDSLTPMDNTTAAYRMAAGIF
jgi:2-methylisocitrate lyase-like PEP mutase family enzyme